ncbi:hypothetical protein UFOVP59_5 [uncultured Caudovirales phage]|uniref:Uncharacterized protein n=1 Tax=uncultured Caudovirales phage TaxID=2100421 RepID=A0A6J5KTT2_9CAUD|nr:hypothetical protein UFOVP59_5 [uncultured Caudovirales phage]CAB5220710.1 hypothetical protein UFOVP246_27 [uncultured Caudovirales phage]
MNWLNDWLHELIAGAVAMFFGAITWLVRTVLTNQKQIAILKDEITSRNEQRTEDRQVWQELKDDIKEVKRDILKFYQGKE